MNTDNKIEKIFNILEKSPSFLKESNNIEFKKSKKGFPLDALETYSSFANTEGGTLILGVTETIKEGTVGSIEITGVDNPDKVIDEFYNLVNNPNKVSKNIINDGDIFIREINNKQVIIINIPQADYKIKPIYLNGSKYHCFKRNHTGDYKCSVHEVDQMIVDSGPNSFDSIVPSKFDSSDLDMETVWKYRQRFNSLSTLSNFTELNDHEFLIKIRALSKDRNDNGTIKPTLAGLLVFGKYSSIRDFLPHYHVEYIDKRNSNIDYRWNDRIIYDGTWGEGNLYNFFFQTIDKLRNSIENKFSMDADNISRSDDGDMIVAIREALVNSIIHCDFRNNYGIKIIRLHDSVVFENGGNLRIPKIDFFCGGRSEPRNNTVQDIFRYIKLCERAGSGIPKIMDVVGKYSLKRPGLDTSNNMIRFTLWDTSISDNASDLGEIEKGILQFIYVNKNVKRFQIDSYFDIDKSETIKYLNSLIEKKYIKKIGKSRSTTYIINNGLEFIKYDLIETLKNMF